MICMEGIAFVALSKCLDDRVAPESTMMGRRKLPATYSKISLCKITWLNEVLPKYCTSVNQALSSR